MHILIHITLPQLTQRSLRRWGLLVWRDRKVGKIFIITLLLFISMKSFPSVLSAYLTPVADGYYNRSYWCCPEEYGGCLYDYEIVADGIVVDRSGDSSFRCGPIGGPAGDSLDLRIGIIEFDIAGLGELFTRGQLQVYLYLMVKGGNLPVDSCLTLYSILDENENGIIQMEDISTMEYVGEACTNLQHEDTISFYVTSAVEHDLFDPDQTNFSGFIIKGSDLIEFYDHTDSVNAPQLSIVISDFDDGIPDDEDNCPDHPNGPDLGTCIVGNIGVPCTNEDICWGEVGSCSMNQEDSDGDGKGDVCDNCPNHPNAINGGTCTKGIIGGFCTIPGMNEVECGDGGFCSMNQEDTFPSLSNGCGDACECEGNFDGDVDQDGSDARVFKYDFGRSSFGSPCIPENPCNGNFNCDEDVDGSDAFKFKEDFGRSPFGNPCPACERKSGVITR